MGPGEQPVGNRDGPWRAAGCGQCGPDAPRAPGHPRTGPGTSARPVHRRCRDGLVAGQTWPTTRCPRARRPVMASDETPSVPGRTRDVRAADRRYNCLDDAARLARRHLDGLWDRPVGATAELDELRAVLRRPLPDEGEDPREIVERLAHDVDPGLVASGDRAGPTRRGLLAGRQHLPRTPGRADLGRRVADDPGRRAPQRRRHHRRRPHRGWVTPRRVDGAVGSRRAPGRSVDRAPCSRGGQRGAGPEAWLGQANLA
jgi:hypothetical protein